jgi:hypothetical protein
VTLLSVPPLDEEPLPTLGRQVCEFIETCAVFGPGSLKGQPAKIDSEKKAIIYRAYELWPKGHQFAGRRRFQRVAISLPKGSSKTELLGWLAYAELHPDAPVRFDGWAANGEPVGRPVNDPYIPLVGVSEEQTEELAYGALLTVCAEGPDADLFDIGVDRILRLNARGRADGKATALAGSPNARDGARTTFQGFDETHRLFLPRAVEAHQTMLANLTKRPLDEPWHMEVTTAGQIGQGSIAEKTHAEADAIARGEYQHPDLLYHHREAGPTHDLATLESRIAAVAEARGGVGEYAPGQFHDIARLWDRPGADRAYLERVWLNRWVRADAQAFDPKLWSEALRPGRIAEGELVVAGFDGARFRDSTAIVITAVESGTQELFAIWERPLELPENTDWEVPENEVHDAVAELHKRFDCWAFWGDPPHWTETFGTWAARYPNSVKEWWTNRPRPMAHAVREYNEALAGGQLGWSEEHPLARTLARHIAAAGRRPVNLWDDAGQQLYLLSKIHPDRKFDAAMAAVLSWQARLEAIRSGAKKRKRAAPTRIR